MSHAYQTNASGEPSLDEAVERWSRSVFGAPRRFRELVTVRQACDEVIERIATEVVRRVVHEQRAPSLDRSISRSRVDPAAVDAFQFTHEALHASSQHVDLCANCRGAGSRSCTTCQGAGSITCRTCSGSGKEVKHFKNGNSKLIKCKTCKTKGTVGCDTCHATGRLTCGGCAGNGHQKVWLTFDESRRTSVVVIPDSAVVVAHPYLRHERFLDPNELATFTIQDAQEARGVLTLDRLTQSARALVQQPLVTLDQRIDRVARQQYLRLAVPRRDVTYEMCGATGRIVLSGR